MSQSRRDTQTGERADLLRLAISTAQRAGDLLVSLGDTLQSRRELGDRAGKKSSETDLVTDADRRAEQLIVELLLSARPHDAILGEEGANHAGSSGITWIIDPLDGTTNFVYGLGTWAVSIAAADGDEVIAGVVYDPNRHETFSALLGDGASLNEKILLLEDKQTELSHSLVGTGFSYSSDRRREQARILPWVLPRVRDVRRSGAAALDLCFVAAGRLDAYFESGLMEWDKAAGALIAKEAGASVAELEGLTDLPTVVVAREELLDELLALLEDAKSRS